MDKGALKLKFGNHNYYVASVKASEIVQHARIAGELEDYVDLQPDERFQRELNYPRIVSEIAPYLKQEDRFFGPLIMAVAYPEACVERIKFEQLSDIQGIPGLYQQTLKEFGVLSIPPNAHVIPLDGQHRLKALEAVTTGRDPSPKGGDRADLRVLDVDSDDVTCLFVELEPLEKSRTIFVKLNKHAKTPKPAEKILLDDKDVAAVVARDIGSQFFSSEILGLNTGINVKGNEVITLDTIHKSIMKICESLFTIPKGFYEALPEANMISQIRTQAIELYDNFCQHTVISNAIEDPDPDVGKSKRIELREQNLLLKPAFTQKYLESWIIFANNSDPQMSYSDVKDLFSNFRTDYEYELLQGILFNKQVVNEADGSTTVNYKMETATERKTLARDLILYMLGYEEDGFDEYELKIKYIKYKSSIEPTVNSLPAKLIE